MKGSTNEGNFSRIGRQTHLSEYQLDFESYRFLFCDSHQVVFIIRLDLSSEEPL